MRSEIFFTSIIFDIFIHSVFTHMVSESTSGDATIDDINRDLCYFWRYHQFPFWANRDYKALLEKESFKFFHSDEKKLVSADEIIEKCKIFPNHILDLEHNRVHFEICYYAKNGFWFSVCKNDREANERMKLLNKFVIVNGKRINQLEVMLLCSNHILLNCEQCTIQKDQVCHYAANGFWKNDIQPDENCQKRFFYTGDNSIDWQEIWNKCEFYFYGKTFAIESVYYPPVFKYHISVYQDADTDKDTIE